MNDDSDSDTEIAEEEKLNKSFEQIQIMKSPSKNTEKLRPSIRGGHSSVFFPNIQYLICFGGSNDKNNNNELFCLSTTTGNWMDCTKYQEGEIPPQRYAHTCVNFMERMILFGGLDNNTYFSDMYHLNPKVDTLNFIWKKIIPKTTENPCGRYGHSLNEIGDKLVLFGGFGADKKAYNDLWVYDIFNNTWNKPTLEGKAPEPRYYHTTSVVKNNLVIYGGKKSNIYYNDVHILNTYTKTWIKVELKNPFQNIPIPPRSYHTATVIGEEYIFILGGYDGNLLYKDIQIFDMEEMVWYEFGNINNVRCKHTANALSKDVIFIFGGHDGSNFLNDMRNITNIMSKLKIKKSVYKKELENHDKENITNMSFGNNVKTAKDEVIEFSSMLEQITKPMILKTLSIDDLENFEIVLEESLRAIKKVKDRKKETKSKKIQFSEVHVKEFKRVVDGGGTVPDDNGPTLGLDWKSIKVLRRRISSFEQIRSENRVDREQYMQKGYIPPKKRANILTKNGATPELMNKNVLTNLEIKKNRKESINCNQALQISGLPVNPL